MVIRRRIEGSPHLTEAGYILQLLLQAGPTPHQTLPPVARIRTPLLTHLNPT